MQNEIDYQRIATAIRFLRDHAREQPSLEDVAAQVHLSKFHFQRLFQEWAGVTPKQFLRYLTLEYAKETLAAGNSTHSTAYASGLSGNSRLHDLFVDLQGCTPGEWKQRGLGLDIHYLRIPTPFGPAIAAETKRGLCRLSFQDQADDEPAFLREEFPQANLLQSEGPEIRRLKQFFAQQRPAEKIRLDLKGTPFQLSVWRALLMIPAGQLQSYGQVAASIGKPAAVRAVGTAIGKNPIACLIPCHRVLRENGQLGGYRWGTERKLAMNGFEAARLHR